MAGLKAAKGGPVVLGSVYADASQFNDVRSGANGHCQGSFFCNAGPGYDGPTGLGTPNGETAFSLSGDWR